jgi:KDO2-lipid IV(A) lauroyltransferase
MGKETGPLREARHRAEPVLARFLTGLASSLSRPACWTLAGVAARAASLAPGRAGDLIRLHRRLVMEPAGLSASATGIYRHVLGGALDFAHLSSKDDETFRRAVTVLGSGNMEKALSRGHGVIAVTAHYSAWELIPRAVSLLGHTTGVVGRRLSNPAVSAMLDRMRTAPGVELIDRGSGARGILRALRRNTAVGILIDQDTTAVEGGFVDFFGIPALTPLGPAKLAVRFGIPLVTLHIRREDDGGYLLRIDEPLDLTGLGDGPDDVLEVTQRLTSAIEGWIREDPRQWIWFHERWARRPDGCPRLWEQ